MHGQQNIKTSNLVNVLYVKLRNFYISFLAQVFILSVF